MVILFRAFCAAAAGHEDLILAVAFLSASLSACKVTKTLPPSVIYTFQTNPQARFSSSLCVGADAVAFALASAWMRI